MANLILSLGLDPRLVAEILGAIALMWGTAWVSVKVAVWKKGVDATINAFPDLSRKIDDVGSTVNKIFNLLLSKFNPDILTSQSPLALDKRGHEIARQVGAEGIVRDYIDQVLEHVQGFNAYQIQEHCFEFAQSKLLRDLQEHHTQEFDRLTDYACNAGVSTELIMLIIGILLRDAVLKRANQSPQAVVSHALTNSAQVDRPIRLCPPSELW